MKIGQKNVEAFEAIEISLFFDNRYSYITFTLHISMWIEEM